MTIERIEARQAENARIKAKLLYEKGTAKIEGRRPDLQLARDSVLTIEMNKFLNGFDIFDLKYNRWGGADGGIVNPVPFRELHGNLLHLQRKLERFIDQL